MNLIISDQVHCKSYIDACRLLSKACNYVQYKHCVLYHVVIHAPCYCCWVPIRPAPFVRRRFTHLELVDIAGKNVRKSKEKMKTLLTVCVISCLLVVAWGTPICHVLPALSGVGALYFKASLRQ